MTLLHARRLAVLLAAFLAFPLFSQTPAGEGSWHERSLFIAGLTKPDGQGLGAFAKNPGYANHAQLMGAAWAFEKTNSLDRITEWRKAELPGVPADQEVFYPLGGADLPNAMTFFPDAPRYTFIALEAVGQMPPLTAANHDAWMKGLPGIRQTFQAMCGLNYFESRMLRVAWSNQTVNGVLPLFLSFIVRMDGEVLSVSNFTLDASGQKVYTTETGKPGLEIRFKKGEAIKTVEYHQMYLDDKLLTNHTPEGQYLKNRPTGITLLKSAVYLYFWDSEALLKELTLQKSTLVLQDDSGIPYASFNSPAWKGSFYGMYSKPGPVGGIEKVPYQKDLEAAYAKGAKPFNFNYGYGILWGKNRANMMVFRRSE
ncbi:MAG: hypothetical protein J0L75_05645 [Spirochaetes bacterium]|nr:hypothetical protein [Spirochaetota bacterium]